MESMLIESFLVHLEAEGRTPKTLQWYRDSLAKFSAWITVDGKALAPESWNASTIRSYVLSLKHAKKANGEPLAATTVSTYARALHAFCRWLHEEGFTERHLLERVKLPLPPKLVKLAFSPEESQALLKATKGSRNALRDEAIVLFLLDTGVRANELCSLREADIVWSQRLAKVFGKGAKERYVPFSAATMKAMQRYALRGRKGTGPWFFQTEEGEEFTTCGLRHLCERLAKKAGFPVNAHKFRHTFAISYLRAGASVFALQKTLGHESLTMTLRYSSLMTEDLMNDHAKHSPVAALLGKRS